MCFAVVLGAVATTVADVLLIAGGDIDRPGRIAWAVTLTVPAALAIASLERRPVLLVPAAFTAVGLSMTLFSGLPLLLVPGIAYFVAYLRAADTDATTTRAAIAIGAPIAFVATATMLIFAGPHREQCVETAHGGTCGTLAAGGSSARLALVVACSVLAVVSGMLVASPSRRPQE